MDYFNRLVSIFEEVVSVNVLDPELVLKYFHPKYQQFVDGKFFNREEFIHHLLVQKKSIQNAQVCFIDFAENGQIVFTHHTVRAEKENTQFIEVVVFAKFVFHSNGQLIECHELTRLIEGDKQDADLGSRI